MYYILHTDQIALKLDHIADNWSFSHWLWVWTTGWISLLLLKWMAIIITTSLCNLESATQRNLWLSELCLLGDSEGRSYHLWSIRSIHSPFFFQVARSTLRKNRQVGNTYRHLRHQLGGKQLKCSLIIPSHPYCMNCEEDATILRMIVFPRASDLSDCCSVTKIAASLY